MNNDNDRLQLSILDVVLIVNVILKMANLVTWSWWFVLWPLWVSLIVYVLLVILSD